MSYGCYLGGGTAPPTFSNMLTVAVLGRSVIVVCIVHPTCLGCDKARSRELPPSRLGRLRLLRKQLLVSFISFLASTLF